MDACNRVPAFRGKPVQRNRFLDRLFTAASFRMFLKTRGQRSFSVFQEAAATFVSDRDHLQFCSYTPEQLIELLPFAEVPESVFVPFRQSRRDFMEFYAFMHICKMEAAHTALAMTKHLLAEMATVGFSDLFSPIEIAKAQLSETATEPQLPSPGFFEEAVLTFKELLAEPRPDNVFLTFQYPSAIWATHLPLPKRLEPNSPGFGKWTVNFDSLAEVTACAKRALPALANQEIGTIKFELQGRPSGKHFILFYGPSRDAHVREVARRTTGKNPFWVADSHCREADALLKLLGISLFHLGLFKVDFLAEPDVDKIKSSLRDERFCRSRGLTKNQAQILLTLLDPEKRQAIDADTSLGHVLDTYFISPAIAEYGDAEVFYRLLPFLLRRALATGHKRFARGLLT